jgi:heat shock protein HtpX
MAAYGLYTHIASNKRRSVALLIGLFFLVYVLVFAGALLAEVLTYGEAPLGYLLRAAQYDFILALPWATGGTILWILIAYKFHQSMIDAVTDAAPVTRKEEPRLYNILENLCISRGIPMPALRIADDEALNAFATGMNQTQYSITVTRGLMETLNDQELEAVLGHELTHIRNGDVRMMVVAMVIAGVISFFGELIFRLFFQNAFYGGRSRSSGDGDRKGGAGLAIIIAIALIVVAWLLSIVIRFSLSRKREFLADAGSVELTKNPDAMIYALRKIEGRGEMTHANSAVMEMCIDNPREGFSNIFDTHPPVDARVEALVKFAGGHDPGKLMLEAPEALAQIAPPQDGPWGGGAQPSITKQAAITSAPSCRNSFTAASAVPPVAIRSSTSTTRSPATSASACTSISSCPYSSA